MRLHAGWEPAAVPGVTLWHQARSPLLSRGCKDGSASAHAMKPSLNG